MIEAHIKKGATIIYKDSCGCDLVLNYLGEELNRHVFLLHVSTDRPLLLLVNEFEFIEIVELSKPLLNNTAYPIRKLCKNPCIGTIGILEDEDIPEEQDRI